MNTEKLAPTNLRAHYDNVALQTLMAIWKQRALIALLILVAVASTTVVLLIMGPRYTAETLVELNFNRAVPSAGSQTQAIAALEASSLVDSAARIIRSRSTASAVVTRLGLDKDPAYTRQSSLGLVLASLQSWLQMPQSRTTPSDLATDMLLGQIKVTNEPRSYLISIKVTARDPEQALKLTNAVVLEYLRGELVRSLSGEEETARHNLADVSSVYGERHPSYIRALTMLESLQARLDALRRERSNEDILKILGPQTLIAAQPSVALSGPNFLIALGAAASVAAIGGAWIATRWKDLSLLPGLFRIALGRGSPS